MTRRGIDVSAHQGAVDWKRVKASGRADFAILRAGYGRSAVQADRRFAENYAGCTENDIPCGAYWYSYAQSAAEAEREAEAAITVLSGKRLAYPVYFDIEDKSQLALSRAALCAITEHFCSRLEAAGYFVGLYSYKSFLEQNLTEEILRRYAVWVAHTGVSQTNYRYPFGMWQYSFTGRIPGIDTAVDLDQATVDYPRIIANAEKNGFQREICPYPAPKRVLRRGEKGTDVCWMQWQLTQRGYPCGRHGIDGSFGQDTERALLAFQRENGLLTDGVCGPQSRKALGAA